MRNFTSRVEILGDSSFGLVANTRDPRIGQIGGQILLVMEAHWGPRSHNSSRFPGRSLLA